MPSYSKENKIILKESQAIQILVIILLLCSFGFTTAFNNYVEYNSSGMQRDHYLKCLSNKRIIIVGDSITRYQYLNLVYFLHLGSWFSSFPDFTREKDWKSWKAFYMGTNNRLGCTAVCDCLRVDSLEGRAMPIDFTIQKENRFWYNQEYNVSINLFVWYPPHPIHGAEPFPTPETIQAQCNTPGNCAPQL
jgi:hypothetical protein